MAACGLMAVIPGSCVTVKGRSEAAVSAATVTASDPVVAPGGTVTVRLVVVAEVTAVATPLNSTVFPAGVGLHPWPWMVTRVPTGPRWGVSGKWPARQPASV